jgi:hypothetical protein
VVKRSVAEFRDDNPMDWPRRSPTTASSRSSGDPAVVSVLGLIGSNATQPLLDNLEAVARRTGAGDGDERGYEPAGGRGAAG